MSKGRKTIKQIRGAERARVKPFNDNGVYLRNPNKGPAIDKHRPISSDQKALSFGMEPISPKKLFDLPPGDAGSGQSVYRRVHVFYPLNRGDGSLRLGERLAEYPYSEAVQVATSRSSVQKPLYFHVSFYGIGVRRNGRGLPAQQPLTQSDILQLQFEGIFIQVGAAVTPITPRFIPSVPTCQARVMVHDESGQRFYDMDIIGNRHMTFFAWGVTVFVLVKRPGFEFDEQNPQINEIEADGYEDDIIGARILPIFTNKTESRQIRTISVTIDPSEFTGARRVIPIPPGARKVQIFSNNPDPAGSGFEAEFLYGRIDLAARSDVGTIDFIGGQSKTGIILIPNAPSIAIRPTDPQAAVTGFSLAFEVEP